MTKKYNENIFSIPYDCEVEYCPYKTAIVDEVYFEIDRKSSEGKILEEMLADKAGYVTNNNTAYSIKNRKTGGVIHVGCYDDIIQFGLGLRIKMPQRYCKIVK